MNKNYDYVLQLNNNDCAVASIMTVLMYYKIKPSREKIISNMKRKHGGYTAYDLIKVSKSYGIDSYGIKTNINNLSKLPAIAHTIKGKNMFHFIVILAQDKKKKLLKVMDPEDGIKIISYDEFNEISTNIFLLFNKNNKTKKEKPLKQHILKIIKSNKKSITKTVILSVVTVILSLIFNYYLKLVLTYNKKINLLLIICIIYLSLALLKNILTYIKDRLMIKLNLKIDKDITNKVINHILNLPYKYFIQKQSGELMTVVEDIEIFKEIVTKVFILSLVDLILILVVIIYTCFLNIYVGLFLFLMVVIILIITKNYQYKLNDSFVKYKTHKISYTSLLISNIKAFETIKNLNISKKISNNLNQKYTDVLTQNKIYNKTNAVYNFIISSLEDTFYVLLIFISIFIMHVLKMELFDIILFSSFFSLTMGLLDNIMESIVLHKVYQTSTDRVLDLLEVQPEKFNKTNYSEIKSIVFENVTYENDNKVILNNINCNFNKGERIYLTGQSGIGKSTMMKLLLKYYSQKEGKILIDNINHKDLDLSFIRNNITYISQNEELFQGTILDNFKLVTSDKNKINEVCKLSLLNEFLSKNKTNLNYFLEEDGMNLSGGERKKIILARGLLHLKNVLILDEVFNEISISEERKILKNIINKHNDKIIIIISHRNSNKDLFTKKYNFKGDGTVYEVKR